MSFAEEEFELPSEPEKSDDEGTEDDRNSFENFLEEIGLEDKYPGKLKLKVFLKLRGKLTQIDLVHNFWQNLTSLNYNAGLPQGGVSQNYSMRDFIFSVLHCCDDFLRQDILEKMSACQLAVPVVLQGVANSKPIFLLWGLRRVVKKWKGQSDSFAIEQPVVSYPVLNISFLRIGDVRISKSQLMNTMLSSSQGYPPHTFFLNRDKDFVAPRFSSGSVECVWFLPMWNSDKEIFKEVIALFNLRGDCSKYLVQTKFVCKAAHLTIALISTKEHKNHKACIRFIKKNSKSSIFISVSEEESRDTTSQKEHRPKYKEGCIFVNVVQMDILSKTICEEIVKNCKLPSTGKTCLESLTDICGDEILIDEQDENCRNARLAVSEIFEQGKVVKDLDILGFKKSSFPLQSFWRDWVEIDKESLQIKKEVNASFERQMERKKLRKKEKRRSQLQTHLSPIVEGYLKMIKSAKSNPVLLQYIIGFMQENIYHMVNENTRNDMNNIADLEREISQIRDQMITGANGNDDCSKSEKHDASKARNEITYKVKVDACNNLYKNCRDKNLGCEHFLRELGQLYEACMELQEAQECQSVPSITSDMALLPSLAALLVTEMQSLEIMDGDTGCVPLTWVTSVLDTLTRELENPKVLVLSVIGVQSSGKSTLLNSMFGVRFPVRAGRCTRGLFIQFLKLSDGLSEELGFHYLVVVDSEGIRSIDHDDRRFDNELVTLALSVANVTVFNIEGENIGPDMTGILQIAAHALMRMKEVDLECHCRIVQQRVSDMTAADRNKANTKKIKETLDEATRFAAEEEGLEGRYRQFCDVVDLQIDEDLHETVTKIRAKLFEDIKTGKIVPELTLRTFTERVRDVWKAIKEENFVFNFNDSVKAVDFNKFCLLYNQWIAQMRQDVVVKISKYVSSVEAIIEKESFRPDVTTLQEYIKAEIEEQRDTLIKHVEDHIANHLRKNTIFRYRQEFLHDINVVLKETESASLAKISDEYEIKKISLNLPHFQNKIRQILVQEAKTEAIKVVDASAELAKDSFDKMWQKMMEKIRSESNVTRVIPTSSSLQNICEKLLLKVTRDMAVGSEIQTLLSKEGGITNHLSGEDCSKYISSKFVKSWLRQDSFLEVETNSKIPDKDNKLDRKELAPTLMLFEELPRYYEESDDMESVYEWDRYDDSDLEEFKREEAVEYMIRIISEKLFEMQEYSKVFDANIFQLMLQKTLTELSRKDNNLKIKLPHRLIAKGLLLFCGNALVQVKKLDGYEIESLLDFDKNVIYADYTSFLHQSDQNKVAADFIYYYVEKLLLLEVACFCDSLYHSTDYQEYTEQVHVSWDILRFLAVTDRSYLQDSLIEIVDEYLEHNGKECRKKLNADAKDKIKSFITNRISKIDEEQSQEKAWKEWSTHLGDFLGCPFVKAAGDIYHVTNVAQVWKLLQDNLRAILKRICDHYDGFSYSLFKNATGLSYVCSENCPMCGAWCDNILESHTVHSSSLHRPRGFTGATYSFRADSAKVGTSNFYSNELVLENCNMSVLSDTATFDCKGKTFLCKNYKEVFPNWDIRREKDNQSGDLFWKWFAAKSVPSVSELESEDLFSSDWDNYVRKVYSRDKIPPSWRKITSEDGLQSLDKAKAAHLKGRQSIAGIPLKEKLHDGTCGEDQ
ncbi:Interferon-induced very large GTPase 1 [Holothuria leucospilota]|uniref:Interferon-induced very large GTPase 1 n=1 Tax=Holothuria leucospilota TaxID=206669 RepID=A0A9Q1BSJ9_HOLLE|nr:Interferon-induced very large GTPase 1 [Holothuria leucospilota]